VGDGAVHTDIFRSIRFNGTLPGALLHGGQFPCSDYLEFLGKASLCRISTAIMYFIEVRIKAFIGD
jgi:hypothetical protein